MNIGTIQRAAQIIDAKYAAACAPHKITTRQFVIMNAIVRGCSQTDLVMATGMDRSTVAEVVRRLVKRGLINRRRTKEDLRAYHLSLSTDGQKIMTAARKSCAEISKAIEKSHAPFIRAVESFVEANPVMGVSRVGNCSSAAAHTAG